MLTADYKSTIPTTTQKAGQWLFRNNPIGLSWYDLVLFIQEDAAQK
jgi:hypothetical protein